jgi:hypothetical protein
LWLFLSLSWPLLGSGFDMARTSPIFKHLHENVNQPAKRLFVTNQEPIPGIEIVSANNSYKKSASF